MMDQQWQCSVLLCHIWTLPKALAHIRSRAVTMNVEATGASGTAVGAQEHGGFSAITVPASLVRTSADCGTNVTSLLL